jgi:hypothetical protein
LPVSAAMILSKNMICLEEKSICTL